MGKQKYTCEKCGIASGEVHGRRKMCNSCYEIELRLDFLNSIIKTKDSVFRKGFSKNSKYTAIQHIKYFVKNNYKYGIKDWYTLLKYYNKYDLFYDRVVEIYKETKNKYDKCSLSYVYQHNDYIVFEDIKNIGNKKLRAIVDSKQMRHSRQEYIDEFMRVCEVFGRVPTSVEFNEECDFSMTGYKGEFGSSDKYGLYGNIVYEILGDDGYNDYLNSKKNFKRKPENGYKKKYSNEYMMEEFNKYIDEYYKEHNKLPSRRLFERETGLCSRTYRVYFGKSWSELLKDKGFTNEQIYSNNRSEIQCLDKVASILNCEYDHQKRFDWLIGNNNFPLFLDGYYPEYDLCIEFSGRQHFVYVEGAFGTYEAFLNQQENDRIKERLCRENCKHFLMIKSSSPWYKEDWLKKQLTNIGISIPNN